MPDREKVINGLESALKVFDGTRYIPEDVDVLEFFARKALDLLKEQEPILMSGTAYQIHGCLEQEIKKEPVKPQIGGNPDCTWWYICPKCQLSIDKGDCFCRHCGRKVEWD